MKKFLALTMAACMMLSMAACGGTKTAAPATDKPAQSGDAAKTDTAGGEMHIGVVVKSLASEYWSYVKAGADAAGKDLGVKVTVLGPNAESDAIGQVGMIEDLISQNVNALAVAPCESNSAVSALQKAADKKIPILAVDSNFDMDAKLAFIGTGNEVAAKLGGDYIAKTCGKGAKAVLILGQLGEATSEARAKGFVEGLQAGGVEILDKQAGQNVSDKAMAVMEDYLQKYSKIDAVLAINDDMAMGAQRAIEQAGRKDIKIIGFDGNASAVDLIMAGKMEASVAQQPYNMGYKAVENGVKAAKGEKIDEVIDTGAKLITKDNAQEYKDSLAKMLGK